MKKIAIVLYTDGLQYDDRVRKEILTIQGLFDNIRFNIFAVFPTNEEQRGVTDYGVEYYSPYLSTRDKYESGTHKFIKAWEFYKRISPKLKEYDYIWCADEEPFLFVLFCKKPILWDLHELPNRFIRTWYMRCIFRYMERKCKVLVHANEPRKEVLYEKGLLSDVKKHFVLRNYPQFNEIDSDFDDTFHAFEKWLGSEKCVYLQGLNEETRAPYESVAAIMRYPSLKAVVVGRFHNATMDKLKKDFGEDIDRRVFFTGFINQIKTPQYIKKCFMSLVFYKNANLNNYFCEANRFYQNIVNGNPVITGNNPPMKELVDKYHFGISIDDDGSDIDKISEAIQNMINNYNYYKAMADENKDVLFWNSQIGVHKQMINMLLS